MIAWVIWHSQNIVVFENMSSNQQHIGIQILKLLKDYDNVDTIQKNKKLSSFNNFKLCLDYVIGDQIMF